MRINAIYGHAIQGEGLLSGVAMPFIRVAGCNLSCSWCDSAYTWEKGYAYTEMSAEAVLAAVDPFLTPFTRWVSLTGGEPTLYGDAGTVIAALHTRGISTIVETNGLRHVDWLDQDGVLVSCSPKLPDSGQDSPIHRNKVRAFVSKRLGRAYFWQRTQWKFVIDSEHDLAALTAYCADVGIDLSGDPQSPPVYLVPNGYIAPVAKYLKQLRWLQDHAPQGTRVCPQVHRLIYGPNAKDV